jgi:hypothetical protein
MPIAAENELERRILAEPRLRAGLAWGAPRWGHPEGSVGEHVGHLLDRIHPQEPHRDDLRFVAIVHDAFKAAVREDEPWSADNDHAILARRFAERFTGDERLLTTIELHDEPYWAWRHDGYLAAVLARVPDLELFARFVELDASTEGKDLSFLWWFRRQLALEGRLPEHDPMPIVDGDGGDAVAYVKTFAVEPADQAEIVAAARLIVAEHEKTMAATGEVLASADGLRVQIVWRWSGPVPARMLRDGDVVRKALIDHPVLLKARPLDARIYRTVDGA